MAAAAGMASRRGLGALAPAFSETPASGRADRLEPLQSRRFQRTPLGREGIGPNPTHRAKHGSKHHLLVDGRGLPLAVRISGANDHDSQHFIPLLAAAPAVSGQRGRLRCRLVKLHADKGYDFPSYREYLHRRGISPRTARRGIESKERLSRYCWVVKRSMAWLHAFRRLRIRYEKRADIHLGFLNLACAVIAWRFVQRFC